MLSISNELRQEGFLTELEKRILPPGIGFVQIWRSEKTEDRYRQQDHRRRRCHLGTARGFRSQTRGVLILPLFA